jgi:hypothetical protein
MLYELPILSFSLYPKKEPQSCWKSNFFISFPSTFGVGAWGGVAFKALAPFGRSRDRFPVVSLDFTVTHSFRPQNGPGIDSAPSENEYQEHILWVKVAGA